MPEQRVLCLPRDCVTDQRRFTPWTSAGWLTHIADLGMTWLPRHEAESSSEFVQPIPCALVLSEPGKYYVFRRIKEGRADLRSRISMIVGGHIDWEANSRAFLELVTSTLKREIAEELGTEQPPMVKPVGLVVDSSSLESSRHVAILHEVTISGPVRPTAVEEFSFRSKYAGRLCTASDLSKLRKQLDPWSSIIFGDYIAPSYRLDIGQQPRLL